MEKKRRVEVGRRLSSTFENRQTVSYQIQEMMRVENISASYQASTALASEQKGELSKDLTF